MRKLIEAIKANKTLLIVLTIVFVLIAIVVIFYEDEDVSTATVTDKSSTEQRLEAILSTIEGVGEISVFVTENDGEVEGVVIVCQGADSIMTRNDILNAVSTALNVNKNIIAIYAMN